jgi:hypothetical protein
MLAARREQVGLGSRCASIVFVRDAMPVGATIADLLLLDECAIEADWPPA